MIEMIIWWETRLFLSNGNLGSVRISRVPVVIGRSLFLYMDILSNSSKMLVSIDQTYNRGFMSTKLIVLILENQYAHCPFIGTGVDLSWDHGYWFWYRSTPVHRVELHPNDRIVRSVLDRAFHLHLVNWLWEIVQNVFLRLSRRLSSPSSTHISTNISDNLRLGDERDGRPPVLAQHHCGHGQERPPHISVNMYFCKYS